MSTEFYLHAELAELSEGEAQKLKIKHNLWRQWLLAPELFSRDEVDPYPKEPEFLDETDQDYIHVGHVEVCRQMHDLISDLPGLIIDESLIETLLCLLKISRRKLHILSEKYKTDASFFYPSAEEADFKKWLTSNMGKRLFARVD